MMPDEFTHNYGLDYKGRYPLQGAGLCYVQKSRGEERWPRYSILLPRILRVIWQPICSLRRKNHNLTRAGNKPISPAFAFFAHFAIFADLSGFITA